MLPDRFQQVYDACQRGTVPAWALPPVVRISRRAFLRAAVAVPLFVATRQQAAGCPLDPQVIRDQTDALWCSVWDRPMPGIGEYLTREAERLVREGILLEDTE